MGMLIRVKNNSEEKDYFNRSYALKSCNKLHNFFVIYFFLSALLIFSLFGNNSYSGDKFFFIVLMKLE